MVSVSVIVPVYNAVSGGRLTRLLESLKAQSLQEIEFVLVFDKPTDESITIAKQVIAGDSRFVFIENERNLHIGLTRNQGLATARGKYIAFADDDDKMAPEMYANLYDIAQKENADIVVSPAIFDNQGNKSIEHFDYYVTDLQQYFVNRLVGPISENERYSDPYPYLWGNGNMWNKIFRRSLIVDNHISFVNTRYCSFEDVLFQLELFCLTNKISYDMTPYYTHIYYENRLNTSLTKEYTSHSNRCAFLSKLMDLRDVYPQMISKDRVEKLVLDTLIDIVSKNVKSLHLKELVKLKNQVDTFNLCKTIKWYPQFLHKEKWNVRKFYLQYILLFKLYSVF